MAQRMTIPPVSSHGTHPTKPEDTHLIRPPLHMGGVPNPGVGVADLDIQRRHGMMHDADSAQFKTPLPRMNSTERHHMMRAPQRLPDYRTPVSRYNGTYHGGMPRPSYQTMYDKTFKPHGDPRQSSSRRKGVLTAKESIRLEEKNRYAQLLQQFTTVPVAGATAYGSSFMKKPTLSTAPSVNESLLGSTLESTRKPSTPRSPQHSHQAVQPVKEAETTMVKPDLTPRAYEELRHARIRRENELSRTMSSIEKDFGGVTNIPSSAIHVQTPDKQYVDDCVQIVGVVKPEKKIIASPKTYEELMSDKHVASPDWIYDLKSRYSSETRQRQRRIEEEEIKLTVYREKRKEWESLIEKRLRTRLKLAEKEPAVSEEDFPSSEEEKEEVLPELSEEAETMVDESLVPYPADQVLVEEFKIQIKRRDIATLAGLSWLNDEVINFYMNLLVDRGKKEGYPTVHSFNTFFYPKLMSGGHGVLKRWTRKMDIFSFDYIVIPVHLGMHWCLAIVDFKTKAIKYYDSMGGKNHECLRAIREYLIAESLEKKQQHYDMSDWELIHVKEIPQQMNGSDCGMFACKFADYVTREATFTFTQSWKTVDTLRTHGFTGDSVTLTWIATGSLKHAPANMPDIKAKLLAQDMVVKVLTSGITVDGDVLNMS